jgi:hypothetical protein
MWLRTLKAAERPGTGCRARQRSTISDIGCRYSQLVVSTVVKLADERHTGRCVQGGKKSANSHVTLQKRRHGGFTATVMCKPELEFLKGKLSALFEELRPET